MGYEKTIVHVSASFEQGMRLFNWLKRYAKGSDDRFLYWDEFVFTADPFQDCDAVLVLNNPSEIIETTCFPEKVIAFMMEPGIQSEHPWMFKGLQQYAAVYSPVKNSDNTELSPGFLGWHVLHSYGELSSLNMPVKKKKISCISSGLAKLEGQRQRVAFVDMLRKYAPEIDQFGKGSNFIENKMDGLLPYRFSIAIENSFMPYYFTEKITDCFLAYTVPVYCGCKNLGDYFPEKSFIQIDINDPGTAMEKIRYIMEHDDFEQRLDALREARDLVLNKYQPLAGAASVLRAKQPSVKTRTVINPVPDSFRMKIRKMLQG